MRHFQTAIKFERAVALLDDARPIKFGRAIHGSQGFVGFGEIGIELERALRFLVGAFRPVGDLAFGSIAEAHKSA